MRRWMTKAAMAGTVLAVALTARAAEYGTAAEAREMLDRVVAALKANKATALAMFSKGEGGFKDRDLYPFCGGPDGVYTATPNPKLVSTSMRDQKDKVGKPIGREFYEAAEGRVNEVTYMWPRPGGVEPIAKAVFCTRIGDQVCCVGYYK